MSTQVTDGSVLMTLNKAQLVMLDEEQLIDPDLVGRLATALRDLEGEWPDEKGDYLACEKELIGRVGPDASNLHLGRSRNDIGATRERMWLRRALLDVVAEMELARTALLDRAEQYVDVPMPSYTHAVQAQPISIGHYFTAIDASLSRDCERMLACFARLNRCPLGSGALGTSGFPLNRLRLSELLGFSELNENSYDSIGGASADTKVEFSFVLATSAINVGRFTTDMVSQHAPSNPGFTVVDEMTGGSSIMPNKRNPGILEAMRGSSSRVVGKGQVVAMLSHNTPFGDVADIRTGTQIEALKVSDEAQRMYGLLARFLGGLVVDQVALRRLLASDYSTMTELADALFRLHHVPFRLGHEFAKRVANFGRHHRVGPADVPMSELNEMYREVVGTDLPLSKDEYLGVVDPDRFVQSRAGRGGPQRGSVETMITNHRADLASVHHWRTEAELQLATADATLQQEFLRRAAGDGGSGGPVHSHGSQVAAGGQR